MQYHKKPATVEGTEQWFDVEQENQKVVFQSNGRDVIQSDVSLPLDDCR